MDGIETSDVAADVAAIAAFLAADTTDVLSAAKTSDGGFCPAKNPDGPSKTAYGLTPGPSQNMVL